MAIVIDWKIKSRSGVCCHTERPFEDEESFFTCIFDDPESDGFIRRDYSLDAWNELSDTLDPPPFSFWKSVYKVPEPEEKEEALPQNSAEAMLHRMIEEDRPATENARFILALMLERKKILIPTEVKKTDTRTLLLYEHKETGSVYIVADPDLKLDEVEKIQEEVSDLLAEEENRGKTPESESTDDEEESENTEAESGEVVDVSDQITDPDGGEPEDDGDQTAEPEEEPVSGTGE